MAFPLRITFAGMCLLVRDPDRSDGRKMLHMLMPPVGGHLARLVFETRLQLPNANLAELTHVSLEDKAIDLSELIPNSSAASVDLDADVFDLNLLDIRPVERPYIESENTFGAVLSRVTLAAGAADSHVPGGQWRFEQPPIEARRMATSVEWFIPSVPDNSLVLNVKGINGQANGPQLTLTPPNSTGEIHLMILNVTLGELPRRVLKLPPPVNVPKVDSEANHFGAYYSLWRPRISAKNPKFSALAGFRGPTLSPRGSAGSELTCMVATALAERG
ncbi:MAG TPA: hypothetical protein VF710_22625 [Longimicrobium sp.]|jgi:hypothetical protein